METTERDDRVLELPDESEYPKELTAHWELLECFSEKEDSRTLLALDRESGQKSVVKCYLRENPLYDHSEPEALRRLDAGPMPRFLAEFKNDQMRCVLREYVPGETLQQLASSRSFSPEEVIGVGLQLCDQLRQLHSQDPPIIHRDIKPRNVVLRPDGTAVLIDFGIARVHSNSQSDTVAFGTQGFAPPEQYGFAQTDARSDLYSLGILLNWLLCRKTRLPSKRGSRLEKVIARCAAFDPRDRYADAGRLRKALLSARPKACKQRGLALMLAAAVLLALLGLGFGAGAQSLQNRVVFSEPLIETAVRASLGLDADTPLTRELLTQVRGIYIVADKVCPDRDSFYAAMDRWYADGKPGRGSIADLSDLAALPDLEELCVAVQEIRDLSPLAGLQQLHMVEFKHNLISDISPLAGMDRLNYVGLNDNPLRDISPLAHCPSLSFLDLCDVRSYDPSVIAELGNFDFLDLSNPTDSYRWLEGKSIQDLRLAWTGLEDLHVLDTVTRLERLEIDHTAVTDLTPLEKHPGLKVLKLTAVPITDLSVLLRLPLLEQVVLSASQRPAAEALGEVPFTILYE